MRYTCSLPALLSLCILAVLGSVLSQPLAAAGANEAATPERTVIFAPIGLGPFAETHADASKRIPREMVDYVKRNKAKFEARLAETLPAGDADIWQNPKTAKRMSSGAHYAIVATIDSIESKKDMLNTGKRKKRSLFASMTVRAINPEAGEVWVKTFVGKVPEKYSETDGQALGQEKQAVQKTAAKCMNALLTWLNSKYDPEAGRFNPEEMPPIDSAPLLDIKFDSIPPGAKIYVDEVFRGITPTTVPLSARSWTIKLERQGYQTWVKAVDVSPEMIIQPALEPVGEK